jgi:antitoxin (DNA-binding transcriptional repressor) of toxin-antitoxin stability system
MTEVTIDEAEGHLRGLIDRAIGGDEVFIREGDDRAVRLVPEPRPVHGERRAGFAKGLIVYMADDFDAPLDDFKDYR